VQTTEQFRSGATIIKQGEKDNGFYVLEKGSVDVYKDDHLLNMLMYPGTIFGEIAFIQGKPRTGTVKAHTAATVTRYECDNIESLIREHPEIAATIIQTLAGRLERTTQKLSDIATHKSQR
jgi:CRP-like cAMP-binding protein